MASNRAFLGTCVLIFAASASATIHGCLSMPGMTGMPMAWLPMCGQGWAGLAASFASMWTVMMVAMMLPSLMPMSMGYRRAMNLASQARLDWLTSLVGAGYFSVWGGLGVIVFPACVAMALVQIRLPVIAQAIPIVAGVVVTAAGALQFTAWKARHLTCCRSARCSGHASLARTMAAWRHGLKLGLGCVQCCAGQTATLLVLGVMDLRVMAMATAAITAERLDPSGHRIARVIGVIMTAAGAVLIMHEAWGAVR